MWGSPPRVRGTATRASQKRSTVRITPACAGNSCPHCIYLPLRQDHPRVCGEQLYSRFANITGIGSPPRVRGTEAVLHGSESIRGITPACAGNRFGDHAVKQSCQDHPRVCGEQLDEDVENVKITGSPPRVRGTVEWYFSLPNCQGITPACAGNSLRSARSSQAEWDHPRVCGEQSVPRNTLNSIVGSPPRVRGTENIFPFCVVDIGITPACAGNSLFQGESVPL